MKSVEHEGDSDTNCIWRSWNGPQRLEKLTGIVGNPMMNRDHPNYSIVKISCNIEKYRRDLMRFASPSLL